MCLYSLIIRIHLCVCCHGVKRLNTRSVGGGYKKCPVFIPFLSKIWIFLGYFLVVSLWLYSSGLFQSVGASSIGFASTRMTWWGRRASSRHVEATVLFLFSNGTFHFCLHRFWHTGLRLVFVFRLCVTHIPGCENGKTGLSKVWMSGWGLFGFGTFFFLLLYCRTVLDLLYFFFFHWGEV